MAYYSFRDNRPKSGHSRSKRTTSVHGKDRKSARERIDQIQLRPEFSDDEDLIWTVGYITKLLLEIERLNKLILIMGDELAALKRSPFKKKK